MSRCYICDFAEHEREPGNTNHVFIHKDKPICQECSLIVYDALLEFEATEPAFCGKGKDIDVE